MNDVCVLVNQNDRKSNALFSQKTTVLNTIVAQIGALQYRIFEIRTTLFLLRIDSRVENNVRSISHFKHNDTKLAPRNDEPLMLHPRMSASCRYTNHHQILKITKRNQSIKKSQKKPATKRHPTKCCANRHQPIWLDSC